MKHRLAGRFADVDTDVEAIWSMSLGNGGLGDGYGLSQVALFFACGIELTGGVTRGEQTTVSDAVPAYSPGLLHLCAVQIELEHDRTVVAEIPRAWSLDAAASHLAEEPLTDECVVEMPGQSAPVVAVGLHMPTRGVGARTALQREPGRQIEGETVLQPEAGEPAKQSAVPFAVGFAELG